MSLTVGAPPKPSAPDVPAPPGDKPPAGRRFDFGSIVTVVAVVAFAVAQVVYILAQLNGPFMDESIYQVAGQRTLEGYGSSDYYLTWFAGSLLYPVLSALATQVGGLVGTRLLSALLVTAAIALAVRAAGLLYGREVRPWAALLAVTSGGMLALGHLAVYDALALVAAAVALCSVAELYRRDDRAWVVIAAVALAVCTLAKYPVLGFVGPPLVGLIIALRGRRAVADLVVLTMVSGAMLVVFFVAERFELVRFLDFRTQQNPSFGVTRTMVAYQLVSLTGVVVVLALAELAHERRRPWRVLALLTVLIGPIVYHVGTGTSVGADKHVTFVVLMLLAPAAATLARVWQRGWLARGLAACFIVLLGVLGAQQTWRSDRSWLDVRPSVDYLAENARPGDRVLSNNAWPYAQALYADGKIGTPLDVFDVYRVQNRQAGNLCDYQWFVVSPGGMGWPDAINRRIAACGTFKLTYQERDRTRIGLSRELRFFTYQSAVRVYRNTATEGRS